MKPTLLLALAAALFSSCASVSVRSENRTGNQPTQKPARIYVADFDTRRGSYKLAGDAGEDPATFKAKTATLLSNYLVKEVSTRIAPAHRTNTPAGVMPAAQEGWLLTGEFVRVNTGSRVLRAGVGLGAGGTKMETRVAVYDLAQPFTRRNGAAPFLSFETTGGSNAMPGLLTNPGSSAPLSMLTQAAMGVTDDAARTSRMITGALSEYFVQRGWLPKQKVFKTKKPGEYQLIRGM